MTKFSAISTTLFFVLFFAGAAAAQNFNKALHDELLAMLEADQKARDGCEKGNAEEQIKCYANITETIDKPHTKRLEEIFAQYGFPSAALVGQKGINAFMVMLQHAPDDRLREKALKPIKKAFERKEISPSNYANFVDRLLVHQGKQQIYGSNLEIKNGRLVMSPAQDLKNLDRRRRKIGLPPIAEYIKILKEVYNLEVETPRLF